MESLKSLYWLLSPALKVPAAYAAGADCSDQGAEQRSGKHCGCGLEAPEVSVGPVTAAQLVLGPGPQIGDHQGTGITCAFSLLLDFRITSFVIPEPSLTSQTVQEGSREQPYHPPDIKSLYCVPANMTQLFQESGHK